MSAHPAPVVRMRLAQTGDAAALSDIFARNFHLACPPDTDPADMAAHIASALSPAALTQLITQAGTEFHVAMLDGLTIDGLTGDTVVGCILLNPTPDEEFCPAGQSGLEIKRLYIDQPWQGKGVAQQLVQLAEQRAAVLGCQWLCLGTSEANARAIAFYRKHGFDIVGKTTFMVGDDPQTDWVMRRLLV